MLDDAIADATELLSAALAWGAANPVLVLFGLVFAFFARRWLNQRSDVELQGEQHLEMLNRSTPSKYDEVRRLKK